MGTYVSMLATIMARRDTPLPLSIGLFGEWGSGKSYFMGLLRDQIRVLAESRKDIYGGRIEQIGFNAWHYTDTNLWASLAHKIFDDLSRTFDVEVPQDGQLSRRLQEANHSRDALTSELEAAHAEVLARRAELDAAREAQTSFSNSLRAILQTATIRTQLDKIWKQLGIDDALSQERLLADEIRGSQTEYRALSRITSPPWGEDFS